MIFEVIFDSFALLIVGLSFAFAFGFISGVGGVVMSGCWDQLLWWFMKNLNK